jgi:Mg2+-importing ATPase
MNQLSENLEYFWNLTPDNLIKILETTFEGLTNDQAERRRSTYGLNVIKPKRKTDILTLLVSQFKNPIIILLFISVILSMFFGDILDALIIFFILLLSSFLGFWQEKKATDVVARLLSLIQPKVSILRENKIVEISYENLIPGDIIMLSAGKMIPADCLIIESKDLFVNEAALTGESFASEKSSIVLPKDTKLKDRQNVLFFGTNVVSGNAKAIIVKTGKNTEFGKISERLKLRAPETDFERGVRRFGYLLIQITTFFLIVIFLINLLFNRPLVDSFLFALALAIGLTPQLLPAIISLTLSKGANRMLKLKVLVKRLNSIENFGSMNVLCSDKTGTLTEGKISLNSFIDLNREEDKNIFLFAYLNAYFQTGYYNPIDEAIVEYQKMDISNYTKLDEIPYDFVRKRLSILVKDKNSAYFITKGALNNVLEVCSHIKLSDNEIIKIEEKENQILDIFENLSSNGFRVLGIAYREYKDKNFIFKEDENDLIFLGFLSFYNPPKPKVKETLEELSNLGINVKVITGDNKLVAISLFRQLGRGEVKILTGPEIRLMTDEALMNQINNVDIYAEVEPNQKERLIIALRKSGNVVGYIGDGINDATALHAADVSISVEEAVDVAKEAADIVLLEKDLNVILQGVKEGRKTFSNTLKYILITTSANFGNMFSMAGASLFLPFLPILPKQILLMNFITDIPALNIASDNVDVEEIKYPRKWNIKFIRKFMITFGLVSSIFDVLTFLILIFLLNSTEIQLRTAWFLESSITELLILVIIRTRRIFYKSRPSKLLIYSIIIVLGLLFIFPYTPLNEIFGFIPLPISFILMIIGISIAYLLINEISKKIFYRKYNLL